MRAAVRLPILVATLLPLTGCNTRTVIRLSHGPGYRFSRITGISGATVAGSDLFIQLEVMRPERTEPETVVLKISTNARLRDSVPSVPHPTWTDGVLLSHFPADALLSPDAVPQDGIIVPIEEVQIERLRSLRDLGEASAPRIRVLAIRYAPVPGDVETFLTRGVDVPPPEDPLLALISDVGGCEPNTIVVSDVQDGLFPKRRAWLTLVPLTALADAVSLPFQLLATLVEGV